MDDQCNVDASITRIDTNEPEWKRLARNLTVTDEQVKEIEDSVSIWNDTIFHQKSHIWIAPPNGGKTTIATAAARGLVNQGFEVLYINLDAGAADLKYYQAAASRDGYRLVAPLLEGSSESDCVGLIEALTEADDLSGVVVFMDTLKKFTDVISKHQSKRLYQKIRAITVRGGTVIALGHTNKHKDSDGQLIYEGTGDLKSGTLCNPVYMSDLNVFRPKIHPVTLFTPASVGFGSRERISQQLSWWIITVTDRTLLTSVARLTK